MDGFAAMYILLAALCFTPYVDCLRSRTIPILMDQMLHAGRHAYDRLATPNPNETTTVNISMYIEGLSSFRTQTMDFQLDVYFQQYWKDPRLAHNESRRVLVRDSSVLSRIWHPDIYFANARVASFHHVTQPNFILWIEPDGSILYDCRISMVVMCMMNLAKWPLDEQRCSLRILSYAYEIDQLKIQWVGEDAITRNADIVMSDMQIVDLSPGLCDGNYTLGVWSCVTAEFYVKREMTHHFIQSYVPTTLIVVISWFSFWLDVEAVPARVSLAITTLLTLSTQANAARMALPEVSYMKAIDVWMGVCMMFVFGVMIEFTIVNYAQRQAYAKADRKLAMNEATKSGGQVSENGKAKPNSGPLPTNQKSPLRQRAKELVNKAFRSNERYLVDEESGKVTLRTVEEDLLEPQDTYDSHLSDYIIENLLYSPKARQLTSNGLNDVKFGVLQSTEGRRRRSRSMKVRKMLGWDEDDGNLLFDMGASPANANHAATKRFSWARRRGFEAGESRRGLQWTNTLRRIKEIQKFRKIAARRGAKKIDQYSRWAFPVSFLIFCYTYWIYYLWIA